jgi:hypothetical protein
MSSFTEILEPLTGYLISINRDTKKGCYVFKIGLPAGWFYKETDDIACEVIEEVKNEGSIINISPKNDDINPDDIIEYIRKIIEVNESVSEREDKFKSEMEEFKSSFEERIKKFYNDLDEYKEKSFRLLDEDEDDKVDEDDVNDNNEDEKKPKPKKRGRPPQKKVD